MSSRILKSSISSGKIISPLKTFIVPKNYNSNFYNKVYKTYVSTNAWGMATSIDCSNCDDTIKNKDELNRYVVELCKLIDMKRFGDCTIVNFGEDEKVAGYSLVQLIETSCISGHFANKTNSAYIDIFSCKPYNPKVAVDFTKKFFKSSDANACVVLRR